MIEQAHTALASIHPGLWLTAVYLLGSVAVSWAIYLLRKLLPGVWAVLEREDKSLKLALELAPAQILGHAAVILTGVEASGAALGIGATVVHLLMKWAPMLSYRGETGGKTKATAVSIVFVGLLLIGCSKEQLQTVNDARSVARTLCTFAGQQEAVRTGVDPAQLVKTFCDGEKLIPWIGIAKESAATGAIQTGMGASK